MESAYDNINLINIDTMKLTWEQFCGFMMERVANVNSVVLEICTFNDTKQLYSYQKYVKNIEWRVPRFIGVVADESEALSLAQSYASYAVQAILVPGTSVNPPISLTINECPLFIEGTITSSNGIKCQDGNNYTLSTTAYRIDGWDENENVVITKIELGEYYTIRSDFTQLVDNYPIYYQYNGFVWNPYTIYTT